MFDELTGRETLRLFALLRGLRPATIAALTAQLAASLGFTKHLDKRVRDFVFCYDVSVKVNERQFLANSASITL